MTKYRKVIDNAKLREELKRKRGILDDWLNDIGFKKLVEKFFIDGFEARIFPKNPSPYDELTIYFDIGKFEYRIQRRLKGTVVGPPQTQKRNKILKAVLDQSEKYVS